MTPEEDTLRQQIIDAACALTAKSLSPGLSGNVSARWEDGLLITPSATPYKALKPYDLVAVRLDGKVAEGQRKPSNETPFHRALYEAFPDTGAIIHTHSLKASALSCLAKPVPAFHYMVAAAGGKLIPCAAYKTPGSDALAQELVTTLKGYKACLMANHGQTALGPSLSAAVSLTEEIENLSPMYIDALSAGEPQLLSDAEMEEVLALFADYRPA